MKAFERMEKLQQRRQEHQAKQAHRRESEPGPGKDEDKTESSKIKRRKYVIPLKFHKSYCEPNFYIAGVKVELGRLVLTPRQLDVIV